MTWIEASGKTLEEAKQAAATELGVAVDRICAEILDEDKGFLGFGHLVRIRATVMDDEQNGIEEPSDSADTDEFEASIDANVDSEAESVGAEAMLVLSRVLEAMKFEAEPKLVSETPEEIQIEIHGSSEDIGRLIGRHGQTLDALQYLVAIAANRGRYDKIRVVLDAEGYRERHKQIIEAKARELARQVKEAGQEAVLEPQNPRDRRIVHMALVDDPDVITYSEGEGDERHVVISPKKQ